MWLVVPPPYLLVSSLLVHQNGVHFHRYAGIVFYWTMLITAVSSIMPAISSGKWVLLLLAVFSFHLTYTGRRYLKFRQGGSPNRVDYLTSGAIILFGLLIWGNGHTRFL